MKKNNKDKEINSYQKRSFIHRLPFGVVATFIKYWFYGAIYFFCFMGLGLAIKDDSLLALATSLIAGALFDIATYNIFILIEEDRSITSKWWFFKNKKVYSLLINIAFEMVVFFLFTIIVIPVRKAMGNNAEWFLKEPLTAALLLIILDTSIIWIKNIIMSTIHKLFLDKKVNNTSKDFFRIIYVSPISITIELNNKDIYESKDPFNVLLDGEIVLRKINKNVFTIFNLMPDTKYRITIKHTTISVTTLKVIKIYKVYEGANLQKVIDNADKYSLISINKGKYYIDYLELKSDITLYIKKDVQIIASTKEEDYPIIPPIYPNSKDEVYGNFEGEKCEMRKSIINIEHVDNVTLIGEGIIDGSANNSTWWKHPKELPARPHLLFINHSTNINVIGLTFKNSPQWTIHPFFSSNLKFLNLYIENPKVSPNTDGLDPQCSNDIEILGVHFSVGDDCIAIKSGKKEIADTFHRPSKNIIIRNCLMENGHGAIVLGSENASGISNLEVSKCLFLNTDRGLRIKTRRGRGKEAIINNVIFSDIKMEGVLTPLTMNMFYNCDPDGNSDYVQSKKFTSIDDRTPYLGSFTFKNIIANDYEYAAGYFYGLPEKYIGEIRIIDSIFKAKDICKEGKPIMMKDEIKCSKLGFIVKNVKTFELNNSKVINNVGNIIDVEDVSEVIRK